MEQPEAVDDSDRIINISASDDCVDQPAAPLSSAAPARAPHPPAPPANVSSSNNSRASRSSGNFRLLLRLELLLVALQIVASVVSLACSTHEKPHPEAPLRALIVAYATGCVAALPSLYWDYCNLDRILAPTPFEFNICFQRIIQFEALLSLLNADAASTNVEATRSHPDSESPSMTQTLVECSRIVLNAFFGYWLAFGGLTIKILRSSSSTAPVLYRLWVVLFCFSCFGHAMAFIVCPILRITGALAQRGGASSEWINALPTYTFKLKRDAAANGGPGSSPEKGGVVAAGTDKERVISGDDAVCSICLAAYADNDELRELPCSHLLHKDCVDKWLKIKATCPLCKSH